ncbi:uncharacterized protein EV422DRAFT_543054 [Fimicolochytrium jonesii]|uniref:uncharacterized protein n=1 Tax=Fimicolochytrium jonesii TaxID=1396493 RepID=UPI0022FE6334|nr:uncharacterized protein EV422DRAFT_543054 [Fimicolochytrium jonesii]KAI8817020.1 hypothetical protein EV422DRAFT_543054 [Fimicolochytrium jonesii]
MHSQNGTNSGVCHRSLSLSTNSDLLLRRFMRDSLDPCIIIAQQGTSACKPSCALNCSRSEPNSETLNDVSPVDPFIFELNPAAEAALGYAMADLKQFDNNGIHQVVAGRDDDATEQLQTLAWIKHLLQVGDTDESKTFTDRLMHFKKKTGEIIASDVESYPVYYRGNRGSTDSGIKAILLCARIVTPLSRLSSKPSNSALGRHHSAADLGSSQTSIDFAAPDFEKRLQKIYQNAARAVGHDFFATMLRSVSNWSGFCYAWIAMAVPHQSTPGGESAGTRPTRLRYCGFYHRDHGYIREVEGKEYNIADTPCVYTLDDNVVSIPDGVMDLFPDNPAWQTLDRAPQSFVAVSILDTETGEYLGVIGMIDDRPGLLGVIGSAEHVRVGLCVFAERAGAEIKRLKMEAQLTEAKEVAVAANHAKTDFISHMSHELRTPMNAVLGMAQLLQDTPLTSGQQELLSTLNDAGSHLLDVINELLDVTKIEMGSSITLLPTPVNVPALLEEVVKLVQPTDLGRTFQINQSPSDSVSPLAGPAIARKKVEIKWEVGKGLPESIMADKSRLKQILINLAANGYKFTDEGQVVIRCIRLEDEACAGLFCGGTEAREVELQFEVQDSGPGIGPEEAARLFKPFVQLDSTKAKHAQGSGLGLTIAHHLVGLMGGKIWVKPPSQERGATMAFKFKCPISEKSTANGQATSPNGTRMTLQRQRKWSPDLSARLPFKILLAEDNVLNARIVRTFLGKFGYRDDSVEHALDGVQAVRAVLEADAKGRMYDILFLDMFMPGLNGHETCEKIMEHFQKPTTSSRPPYIVALTANASVEDRDKCLAIGMRSYLTKPLLIQDLYDALVEAGRERDVGDQGRRWVGAV